MRTLRLSPLATAGYAPQVSSLQASEASANASARESGTSETAMHSMGKGKSHARLIWQRVKEELMDTFVENTGVAEQEKRVAPTEHEKQIQIPIENAETASEPLNEDTTMWESQGKEPEKQIKIVPAEKPDPLGRKIASLPLNEMKAGYDYAFGKDRTKR